MSRIGRQWPAHRAVVVSDLRSQLLAQFGGSVPEAEAPSPPHTDGLSPNAHLDSEWYGALKAAVYGTGIKLNPQPSLGAARQAHDLLCKRLKADGAKRQLRELSDLRSRFEKKREKLAWTALKSQLSDAGVSDKLYRSLKQSKVGAETLLSRWSRVKSKGLNQAELRARLLNA